MKVCIKSENVAENVPKIVLTKKIQYYPMRKLQGLPFAL